MAITFNNQVAFARFSYSPGDSTNDGKHYTRGFTGRGTSGVADLFADNAPAGAFLVFDMARATSGKFQGITLNIATPVSATGLTLIWEYAKITGPTYLSDWNWYPLQNVVDTTNNLTQSGTVTWDVPEDWTNAFGYFYGSTQMNYPWIVRCRIVSYTTFTEGGRTGGFPTAFDYAITVIGGTSGTPLTLQDIYNADVAGSWGKVIKNSNSYHFNCGLKFSPTTYFTSKQEIINFGTNFDMWTTTSGSGVYLTFGELDPLGNPRKGTVIQFNGYDCDYGGYVIRSNGKMYNCQVKCNIKAVYAAGSSVHGHWGAGIGTDGGQEVMDMYIENFRQTSFNSTANVMIGITGGGDSAIGSDSHLETCGAIIKDFKAFGGSYSVRPLSSSKGNWMHDCDFSGATYKPINPYNVQSVDGWYVRFLNCDFGTYSDTNKVFWNISNPATYQNSYCPIAYSCLLKIIDSTENPISGATVTLKNKDGNTVWSYTSNTDGYVGEEYGTLSEVVDAATIRDASKTWTTDQWWYREILLTSGNGKGQQNIVKKGNTSITLYTAWKFPVSPVAGDRYLVVPYIDAKILSPLSYAVFTQQNSAILDNNPFTITVSKTGYETYEKKMTVNKKIDEVIKLNSIIKIRKSVDGSLLKALQPETGSASKLLKL